MSEAKRNPKIHFAALVGVDVDSDLLPWWIPHYKALGLDSYTVFLHESLDVQKNIFARRLFLESGFLVHSVPENAIRDSSVMAGCPDGVRRLVLDAYAKSHHPRDFLITADGDEIQEWEESPHDAVKRGVSVMLGRLVDRYDDTLHDALPNKTLEENFPGEHPDLHEHFKKESLMQKKICMAPASYPVEYSGSHDVIINKSLPSFCRVSGPIRVLHFRWRRSAIARVQGRYYWSDEDIAAMKQFFSVED